MKQSTKKNLGKVKLHSVTIAIYAATVQGKKKNVEVIQSAVISSWNIILFAKFHFLINAEHVIFYEDQNV